MNSILDIIYIPFGFIIKVLYNVFGNYALTLFFFAVVVKIAMIPLTVKQQKGQIKMAKLRPKEQAIRKKYAGRTDTATQQKMQTELMEMYRSENHSPMGGCLPMLIQLPIIIALYGIVREPLKYIASFSTETLLRVKEAAFNLFGGLEEYASIFKNITETNVKNIAEIDIVKIMHVPEHLAAIMRDVSEIPADFKNINMMLYGDISLADAPAALGMSLLLLVPVLNFVIQFFQMRLTKKLNAGTPAGDMANNKSMKMMEYTAPLLSLYVSYTLSAALGIYWIFQGAIQIVQSIIIAKIYPIPKVSEEEYKLAEKEYGIKNKQPKKPRRPYQEDEDDDYANGEDLSDTREGDVVPEIGGDGSGKDNGGSEDEEDENGDKDSGGEKYVSENLPKGINPAVKNNYQKTGRKYSIKKKKK